MMATPVLGPVMEVVNLEIDTDAVEAFLCSVYEVRLHLLACDGLLQLGLERCLEQGNRFTLRLEWEDVTDVERFRASSGHVRFHDMVDRFIIAASVSHFVVSPGFTHDKQLRASLAIEPEPKQN